MAYSFRVAPQDRIEQGSWLYVSPTRPPRSSLEHWSAPSSYFWMYNGQGATLEVSDKYGLDNLSTAAALTFPTDSVIEIGDKRYEFYCIAQLHENTPELNGYTNQNVATIYTYDGGLAYYFYTKIYRLAHIRIRVNFNSGGGTVSPAYTTAWTGDTITLPTPTWDSEHTFKGWWYDGSRVGGGGDTWTVPDVDSDITLTAKWREEITGDIIWAYTQQHVVGTYTFINDNGEFSLSWQITSQTIIDNGRTFHYNQIRIHYLLYDWHSYYSSAISGTFDRTTISASPQSIAYPPTCTMYYFQDYLLRSRSSDALIFKRGNGKLCYGPKTIA